MKQFLLGLILCTLSFIGKSQDVWYQRDSVNGPPKASCVGFALNNEGYIGLGLDQLGFKRSMFSYSWIDDDWDKEESLGGESGSGLNRASAVAFVAFNKAYVGLGNGTAPFYNDLWEYNPYTETWTQKASFIGSPRRDAVGFSVDNVGYVGTGEDANGLTRDFYSYDATSNTWTQLNDFGGTARKAAVGFAMGGQAYVGTGDDGVFRDDFWQYDVGNDAWVQKADFPGTRRTGATGWGIFPNAFIATGYDTTLNYTNDVWSYNYFDDSWNQVSSIPGPARSNAVSFVIDDRAYLGTGYNNNFLDDFYEYFPILSTREETLLSLNLYPNPGNGRFTINSEEAALELVVFDLLGQQVEKQHTSGAVQLNLSHLPKGTYLLVARAGNKNRTQRIVIQ